MMKETTMTSFSSPIVTAKQLKAALQREAEHFDMFNWARGAEGEWTEPPCGTTLCLAGMACIAGGDKIVITKLDENAVRTVAVDKNGAEQAISVRAAELLGLESWTSGLFYVSDWPTVLEIEYTRTRDPIEHAKIGAKAIDYFLLGIVPEEEDQNGPE
jgi:hypothetical protein